jgi:hypothetical protein
MPTQVAPPNGPTDEPRPSGLGGTGRVAVSTPSARTAIGPPRSPGRLPIVCEDIDDEMWAAFMNEIDDARADLAR